MTRIDDAAASRSAPPLSQAMWVAAVAGAWLRDGVPLDRGLLRAQSLVAAQLRGGEQLHPRAAAAAKDLAFTAARHRALTDALVARLASRPPAPPVQALLGVALAQLYVQRRAAYTVVDQAVRCAKEDDATRAAAGFVNGVLRNALRQFDALLEDAQRDDTVRYNLPAWWLDRLQKEHPQQWRTIAQVQRCPPPLVLRINPLRTARAAYRTRCAELGIDAIAVGDEGLWLTTPRPVDEIPGFAEGLVAVQDAGAQLAAQWLDPHDGMRVLDACAAPGGKSAHLAARAAIDLVAVDSDGQRATRIEDNLARLGVREGARAQVLVDDVGRAATSGRWPPASFDRILLDAPCTASGIVRRHPDIPWLRRPADVVQLATQQSRLLDALWPLLAPAGRLLYAVCSVFADEGPLQIERFLARTRGARAVPLPGSLPGAAGVQLLPTEGPAADDAQPARLLVDAGLPAVHDGFYYALLEKH